MKTERIIEEILDYFMENPGVGHTTAVLNGARETGAAVMFKSYLEGRKIAGKDVKVVIPGMLRNSIWGSKKPLVLDNHILSDILLGILQEMGELREERDKEVGTITRQLGHANMDKDRLRSRVRALECELDEERAKSARFGKRVERLAARVIRIATEKNVQGTFLREAEQRASEFEQRALEAEDGERAALQKVDELTDPVRFIRMRFKSIILQWLCYHTRL